MKVGIITFHRVINYGAVLQAYALQETLGKLGFDAEIIDYRKRKFEKEYRSKKLESLSPRELYNFLKCKLVSKKNKAFLEYVNSELKLSAPCNNVKQLKNESEKYDAIITGSDQVFNLELTDDDHSYFIRFADSKKIKKLSYAASMGYTTISDERKWTIKKLLRDYLQLSVREIQAQEFLKEIGYENAEQHIDPSLLLKKEEWQKYSKPYTGKPYVVIYSVKKNNSLMMLAKHIAQKHGLRIKYVKYLPSYVKGAEVLSAVSPSDFVDLIDNAYCVITNLFHGTAFSIALRKNFYVIYQENVKTNNRIDSLVSMLGLNERVRVANDYTELNEIDYSEVEKIIEAERKKAIKYLRKIGEC